MKKKTIDDIDVRGKRLLVRLDLNVPLDETGHITDDRRIEAAVPTLRKLVGDGGRLVLMSHLGRPEGPQDYERLSLAPVAKRLGELLGNEVRLIRNYGEAAGIVDSLGDGHVVLLENLRFHEAETIKDKKAAENDELRRQKDDFAKRLAALADVYVNDAFGTCHRDNASMLTVPKMMEGKPRVIGYLVCSELKFLGDALANPARPFVCVLGGAKVSDKLGVIRALLGRCDAILIGGAMAYTFLKARGQNVGESRLEEDLVAIAGELLTGTRERLRLPADSVVAERIERGIATTVVEGDIPSGKMGLDIGPKTAAEYEKVLSAAKTIFWNGPMGVFETPPFHKGTLEIARALAQATKRGATTIIGGGDSAAAVEQAGLAELMTHISTGGGASLEFLEGKPFAALEVLDDAA